jgi:hypothetical protein
MYTPLEPDDDLARVLDAITRRSLARRGKVALLVRLDAPDAVVRLELDDENSVRIHLDGTLVNVVPHWAVVRALEMARAGRGREN